MCENGSVDSNADQMSYMLLAESESLLERSTILSGWIYRAYRVHGWKIVPYKMKSSFVHSKSYILNVFVNMVYKLRLIYKQN